MPDQEKEKPNSGAPAPVTEIPVKPPATAEPEATQVFLR